MAQFFLKKHLNNFQISCLHDENVRQMLAQ